MSRTFGGGAGERRYDAVVIGAGHNGLITAAYLGRAGLRVLVLERGDRVGGALATVTLGGVRVPAAAHTVGRLRASIIRDLRLTTHGLRLLRPDVRVFAPQPDGRAVTFWADARRTADELQAWSTADADAYPLFDRRVRSLASFLAYLDFTTPPDLKAPTLSDALGGVKLARAFRRLGRAAGREMLRVLPMAVADFVGEAFQTEAVRGALASRGVRFTAMGPWSAGTTAVLLGDSAGNDGGAPGEATFASGGPAALADALASAARSFGVEIRTGAEVARIAVAGERVVGAVLASGQGIHASAVVSAVDPKRTLLGLMDPVVLGPTLVWRAGNYRMPGAMAKVNLALSGMPDFPAANGDPRRLQGRIVVAPSIDDLERGFDDSKYGRVSGEPFLEATIPSLMDPSLAPNGGHAMSVLVQWAPYQLRESDWAGEREGLGDLVLKSLERHAPGISDLVTERQVLTPVDLERDFGLTGGHPLHGESSLAQFFAWRPLLGHARYRLAGVEGLYLCGAGAHPGGGVTGGPGANAAREILADWKRRR